MSIKQRLKAVQRQLDELPDPVVPSEGPCARIERYRAEIEANRLHGTPLSPELADGLRQMHEKWGDGLTQALENAAAREAGRHANEVSL